MRLPITIDQSHELVELDQLLSLNGKSWRVVQIEPGPSHFGYRVAAGTDVERLTEAMDDAVTPRDFARLILAAVVAPARSEASVVPLRVTVWLEEA